MATTPQYHFQDPQPASANILDHWVRLNGEDRILTPSGWVLLGNLFAEYGGCIPRKGGIATGAIGGAHGHAEAHNARLTGDAKLEEDGLVTTSMLDEALAGLRDMLSGTGSGSGSAGSGSSGGGSTIPGTTPGGAGGWEYAFAVQTQFVRWMDWHPFNYPVFKDGTRAKPEQCVLTDDPNIRSWMFSLAAKYNGTASEISGPWDNPGNAWNWSFRNQHSGWALQAHDKEFKVRVVADRDDRHPHATLGLMVSGICIARR